MGMELGDAPRVFGWDLVLFESHVEETMSGIGYEPVPEPSATRTRLDLFSLVGCMTRLLIWIGLKILKRVIVSGLIL